MFENLTFNLVNGSEDKNLKLLTLSTCGFCKRAMEFLKKHGQKFYYLHLDEIDPLLKAEIKDEFIVKFNKTLSYPTLIINNESILIGFIQKIWEDTLNLPPLL